MKKNSAIYFPYVIGLAVVSFAVMLLFMVANSKPIDDRVTESKLTLDKIFPSDRVLKIDIIVDEKDWDNIRFQRRDMKKQFAPERQFGQVEGPYSYVPAKFVIDGVEFPKVAIRKKGLLGSLDDRRPSLKVKLNFYDPTAEIDGLPLLTFNNNRQDSAVMSQFMGYNFFNSSGSPAPRCAYAQVTVNGTNLGVYSHVESAKKQMVERAYGNSDGTFYEGTVVDFNSGWEKSFDRKFGDSALGEHLLMRVIKSLTRPDGVPVLKASSTGRAMVPNDGELETSWTELEFDDSTWALGRNGAGYERGSGFEDAISKEFDFGRQMYQQATSLYLRFPFEIVDRRQLDAGKLFLLMKYDDGFVAYLNGEKIAAANAPESPSWNSVAPSSQGDDAGNAFQVFEIEEHKSKFRIGKNVLAIHGMNSSAQSSDLLFVAKLETNNFVAGDGIEEVVDLDDFYRFWAIESLLGFWDGYTANRNNFFVYANPNSGKIHFMPWGADCMFEKFSYIDRNPRLPLSVKVKGRLNYTLYQSPAGRERYRQTLIALLDDQWDEVALLKEVDRVEALVKPYLSESQSRNFHPDRIREFIRTRRKDLMDEIEDGMPSWPLAQ